MSRRLPARATTAMSDRARIVRWAHPRGFVAICLVVIVALTQAFPAVVAAEGERRNDDASAASADAQGQDPTAETGDADCIGEREEGRGATAGASKGTFLRPCRG